MKRFLCGFAALGLLVGVAGHVQGQGYTITYTITDAPNATDTYLSGINDLGIAVGWGKYADGTTQGFMLDTNTGNFTNLDLTPSLSGVTAAIPFGISNNITITGSLFRDGIGHGFLCTASQCSVIDPPGAAFAYAIGVNDQDHVVGSFLDSSFSLQGFLYIDGNFTNIAVPGATSTSALGINNQDQVVGTFDDGARHGFLRDTVASVWQFNNSFFGYGISGRGDMVGVLIPVAPNDFAHGAMIDASMFTTRVEPSGAMTSEARGISPSAQTIVGDCSFDGLTTHGFVAKVQ